MTPVRNCSVTILLNDGAEHLPIQGLCGSDLSPELSQEGRAPVVPIIGARDADRRLMRVLKRTGTTVSVLRPDEESRVVSVVCEYPFDSRPDLLAEFAQPTVEIVGAEQLLTKCHFSRIVVKPRFLEIMIEPSNAYLLDWNEGIGHVLPAVWLVVLYTEDEMLRLENRYHDASRRLRLGSIVPPSR